MKKNAATARKGKAKAQTASSKPKRKLIWRWESQRSKQARQIAYSVAGIFIVVLAGLTVSRNRDWKDELSVLGGEL